MSSYEDVQKQSIPGVVTGVVKENWNDKHPGMVQVEISIGEKEKLLTDWIRVVQPYVGDCYGTYWLPEVGDEVLLAFQNGDLNCPYVIGSLCKSNSKITIQTASYQDMVKRIKTPSGNEIVFSDEKDKARLEIYTPKNLKITLEDETQTISIQDKNGKSMVAVDAQNGEIKITGENTISLNASNGGASLILNGDGKNMTLKADTITLCSGNKIEIKSSANLKLESGGIVELKGGLIEMN